MNLHIFSNPTRTAPCAQVKTSQLCSIVPSTIATLPILIFTTLTKSMISCNKKSLHKPANSESKCVMITIRNCLNVNTQPLNSHLKFKCSPNIINFIETYPKSSKSQSSEFLASILTDSGILTTKKSSVFLRKNKEFL